MDERCYFGCEGPIRHTLLELPPPYSGAPDLCDEHSKSWRTYQAALRGGGSHPSWPEDFWPWADKERKAMEEAKASARQTEDRVPGTEILAEEAVVGAWYIVPSGETERCVTRRARGRGIQVGFVSVFDPGNDSDDIRWLPGRTKIAVEDEIEAAKLLGALARDKNLPSVASDLPFSACPRNGLVCRECELPQRTTPSGDTCEGGHGGVPGIDAVEVANRLGSEGYAEEARAILDSVPPSVGGRNAMGEADQPLPEGPPLSDDDLLRAAENARIAVAEIQAASAENGAAQLTEEEINQEISEVRAARKGAGHAELDSGLAMEANALTAGGHTEEAAKTLAKARLGAGPTTIFHKSLHIDHRTPKELFEAETRRWGKFYLDCAGTEENKLCEYVLTPEIDALSVDWAGTEEIYAQHGRNRWLNHPYSPGEEACPENRSLCLKKKCVERGYHIDQRIASSGEWITYARDQVLKDGIPTDVLTKAAIDTNWWRDAIRIQPPEAGAYLTGAVDPLGGPAAEFLNATRYRAGMWFRLTWERLVVEVTEIEGRVAFEREGNKGGAGFASALVMFYRPGHKFHE